MLCHLVWNHLNVFFTAALNTESGSGERKRDCVSWFIGLAFRDGRNPVKEKRRGRLFGTEGEEKQGRKDCSPFPLRGLLSREMHRFLINEKMEKFPLPPPPPPHPFTHKNSRDDVCTRETITGLINGEKKDWRDIMAQPLCGGLEITRYQEVNTRAPCKTRATFRRF